MKKLLLVLALICVLPPAYADKPRNHHVRIGENKTEIAALAVLVANLTDQSVNIATLQAQVISLQSEIATLTFRVDALEFEQEHPDVVISQLFLPPSKVELFVGTPEPLNTRDTFTRLFRVDNAIQFDLVRDEARGTKWVFMRLRDGTQRKTSLGDWTASMLYIETEFDPIASGTELFWPEKVLDWRL